MSESDRLELSITVGPASFDASGDSERVMAALDKFSDLVGGIADDHRESGAAATENEGSTPAQEGPSRSPSATGASGTARRRTKAPFRGTRLEDLEAKLTAEVRAKLEAYVDERRPNFKEATDQAAILATFLEAELGVRGVSADDLYTVYAVMGWPAPNPRNALANARMRKGYFSGQRDGKFPLTHTGERFGRHEAKRTAE